MATRIGAWLAVWIGLWLAAAGCGGAPRARAGTVLAIEVAPDAGLTVLAVDELARLGRQFASGVEVLSLVREHHCRGRRSPSCDRIDRQLAELEAIAEQVRVMSRPGLGPDDPPIPAGGRRVMKIVPAAE